MEAVVCIFAPALDQFEVPAEISSYGAHSSQLSYCVIYAVIICNFFLVITTQLLQLFRDLCCNHPHLSPTAHD
jgi:hypothetical protein